MFVSVGRMCVVRELVKDERKPAVMNKYQHMYRQKLRTIEP